MRKGGRVEGKKAERERRGRGYICVGKTYYTCTMYVQ